MERNLSNGCNPQSKGYPKIICNQGSSACPGKDICGKSNRKCYCSTTLFPKANPIEKARRRFEQELLPISTKLSDLQNKVRSMHINEMRDCICGALVPDNPFPDPITCTCTKFLGPKPAKEKPCRCDGKSISSYSSNSSSTSYSSFTEEDESSSHLTLPKDKSKNSLKGKSIC